MKSWFKRKERKTIKQQLDEERQQIKNELHIEVLKKINYDIPPYNNWRNNKYAERLISEWLEYGKVVLAVDFDDTISPWKFKGLEANVQILATMETIQLAQSVGCYVVIWTACAPERFDEIKAYCANYGIKVDSINENPIALPYGNHRKMYYNHLLDDRAGLTQALSILEYACYRVIGDRKTPTQNFDV